MATRKRRPDITTAQPVRKKAKISALTKAQIRRENIKTGELALSLVGRGGLTRTQRSTAALNKISRLTGTAKQEAKKKFIATIEKRERKLLKGRTIKETIKIQAKERAGKAGRLNEKFIKRQQKILERAQNRRKKK